MGSNAIHETRRRSSDVAKLLFLLINNDFSVPSRLDYRQFLRLQQHADVPGKAAREEKNRVCE